VEQIGREGVLTMADGRRRAGSSLVMMEKENHMTRADDREAIAGESNFGDGKANLALEGGSLRVTFVFRQKKKWKTFTCPFSAKSGNQFSSEFFSNTK
jgi:hypothetical protein